MRFKNKSLVTIILLIVGITSCDVDRLPETVISDPSFWASENDIQAAANYLYTYLPGLPVTSDIWSDDAVGLSPNSISDGTRLAPATDGSFNTPYRLIRAANNLIEKGPRVLDAGVETQIVESYIGEARFFRAWAYFSLLQRYGGVPLILETLSEDSPLLTASSASREEVIRAIYDDLDYAVKKLQEPENLTADKYGRISNTAALAFKSRVALFEGTRSKFHNYGDAIKHLTIAKNAAKAVIDSEQHDLFSSYFDLFQYEGEGRQNKENILVRKYGKSIDESITSHTTQRTLETGAASPTKVLADAFLMIDGLPLETSPMYEEPTNTVEVFKNRDPRMSHLFFKRGDSYIATQTVFDIPALTFHRTGFANRSYANITDWNNSRSYIDYPIIRYAEVLLNYAEATFELEDAISDEDLDLSVNKLRARVNMPNLTNSSVLSNNLNMREEIRRERRVELALQGFRYWDLIRWKTAEIELPKVMLGNIFFDEFGTEVIPDVNEENFILLQKSEDRFFDPSKDYLWPFPINELALNPNLKQNPNW